MKFSTLTRALCFSTLGFGIFLAGCNGVGEGVLPVNAVIQPLGGVEGAASTKAFTCLNTGLTLILDFSDGSRGDFTSRARYSSSNVGVVKVSNLDIPVPDQADTFFARGILVPVAPGTATITVNYLSFTRSIDVTVTELQNFRATPETADLATKSLLDLAVSAELDGVTTPIDSAVVWSIVTPDTSIATIDASSGTLTGIGPGQGLTAQARLAGCERTVAVPVTVSNLQSLALSREFGDNGKLVVATTERVLATGTLENGKTQDLSQQVTFTSSNTAALSFFTGSLSNLALALAASDTPVQVSASFDNQAVTAPSIDIQPVADSLNTIVVSPATAEVAAGLTTQLKATGSYASGATQDITRHVGWTSSDTTAAVVQSSNINGLAGFAGLVSTASNAAGKAVTITATTSNAASETITSAATVNIR